MTWINSGTPLVPILATISGMGIWGVQHGGLERRCVGVDYGFMLCPQLVVCLLDTELDVSKSVVCVARRTECKSDVSITDASSHMQCADHLQSMRNTFTLIGEQLPVTSSVPTMSFQSDWYRISQSRQRFAHALCILSDRFWVWVWQKHWIFFILQTWRIQCDV